MIKKGKLSLFSILTNSNDLESDDSHFNNWDDSNFSEEKDHNKGDSELI